MSETTNLLPRQGTLFYMEYTNNFDIDSSGVKTLDIDLKKFSYDLDNMEDTYARFVEVENEVKQNFPSSILTEGFLEKIWDVNNTNPALAKVVEIIRQWNTNIDGGKT